MDLPNPAVNPPRLPSPSKRRRNSRSPSRSPTRQHYHARQFDPLLRDLSPSKTLRALSNRDVDDSDVLGKSIETASDANRALGVKAARACVDLRAWVRELEEWHWPGTFDVPEPARKKQRLDEGSAEEEEYWGSLPAETVQRYRKRLDEITDDFYGIDVEELKDYVLSAHSQAGFGEAGVEDSIGAIGADTNLKRLDDFTAVVTATILQTLPFLSRLGHLLDTWVVRVTILRSTYSYLHDLGQAQMDLDHGWAALAVSSHPAAADALRKANAHFSRTTMMDMKNLVQNQVSSLGKRLDSFLDLLEGREECVPDRWIEDFEVLEEQYGDWVVQAERRVLEGEWAMSGEQAGDEKTVADSDRGTLSEVESFAEAMNSGTGQDPTRTVHAGSPTATATSGPQRTTTPLGFGQARASVDGNNGRSSPRHIPINVDDYQSMYTADQTPVEVPADKVSPIKRSLTPIKDSDTEATKIRKRAAFFNDQIERNSSLNRNKPAPIVRPFERASNAFTRLFKHDKEANEERAARSQTNSPSAGTDDKRDSGSKGRRGSNTKSGKKAVNNANLDYGDLARPYVMRQPQQSQDSRRSSESSGKPKKAKSNRNLEYMDMVRVPGRLSSDRNRRKSSDRGRRTSTDRPALSPTEQGKPSSWNRPVISPDGNDLQREVSEVSTTSSNNITTLAAIHDDQRESSPEDKRKQPPTYKPTGMISPTYSPMNTEFGPDVPENWPLSSQASPSAEGFDPFDRGRDDVEARPSDGAVDTDAFDRMFVENLPSSPRRPLTAGMSAADEKEYRFGHSPSNSLSRPRTATSESFVWDEKPRPDYALLMNGFQGSPNAAEFQETNLPRPVSMVIEQDEEAFSSDEVGQEDGEKNYANNAAAYFGGGSHMGSPREARHSTPTNLQRPGGAPPANSTLMRLKLAEDEPDSEAGASPSNSERPGELIRSASATSIEAYSRSELKSVNVGPRRSSVEPVPKTPTRSSSDYSRSQSAEGSPLQYNDNIVFPSPPKSPPVVPPRRSSLASVGRRSEDGGDEINSAIPKRNIEEPTKKTAQEPSEDNFDRHVSEVLDRVHVPIKFRSRPGAITPNMQQKPTGAKLSGKKNMTLAPAEASPRRGTHAEPEVKLYHLIQAGRADPIKLYVRLVGDSERVMVRVGGGWADLEDYLRQYAEHHGSRTVSESVVELQTAGGTPSSSASGTPASGNGGKRTFSGPAATEQKSAFTRASNGGTPLGVISTPAETPHASKDSKERVWLAEDSDDPGYDSPTLPTTNRSRESTFINHQRSNTSRSESRQGDASMEIPGLAGPASGSRTKADLPDQKAKWVEGMIERVNQTTSAEKNLREERERQGFGDMGKAGTTRRLVFRKFNGDGAGGK